MSQLYVDLVAQGKTCCTCKNFKLFENFSKSRDTEDGYRKQCQSCRRVCDKAARGRARLQPDYYEKQKGWIQCKRCGKFRLVRHLRSAKSKGSDCFKCNAAKTVTYRAKPEVQALYSARAKQQIASQGGVPNSDNGKGKIGAKSPSWKGGKPKCLDCGSEITRHKKLCKPCAGKLRTGNRSSNWKGGVSNANEKARKSREGYAWRKSVFVRDSFTCQLCGQVGGKLHAHHKKEWAKYKELRFEINNGATLCRECHLNVAHQGAWKKPPLDWEILINEHRL